MALCGKAEAEARGKDPLDFDKLTFFKCMLMLSSDFVYTKRLEDELPNIKSISHDNTRSHTVITSKNYPGNYPTNYYEQWVIETDEPEEYVIELSFYSFNLEYDSNCYYDWVEVSYGSYSERFCGYMRPEKLPLKFVTTETSMTIKMNSNSLYTYSGFYARKNFIKKSDYPACECGKEGNTTTTDASSDRIIGGADISHVSKDPLK